MPPPIFFEKKEIMSWLSKQLESVGKIYTSIGKTIIPKEGTFIGDVIRKAGAILTPYGFTKAGEKELKTTLGDTGFKIYRGAQIATAAVILATVAVPTVTGTGAATATGSEVAAGTTSAATSSGNILSLGGSYSTLSATSSLGAVPISASTSASGILSTVGTIASNVAKIGAKAATTASSILKKLGIVKDPALSAVPTIAAASVSGSPSANFKMPDIPQWMFIAAIGLFIILIFMPTKQSAMA